MGGRRGGAGPGSWLPGTGRPVCADAAAPGDRPRRVLPGLGVEAEALLAAALDTAAAREPRPDGDVSGAAHPKAPVYRPDAELGGGGGRRPGGRRCHRAARQPRGAARRRRGSLGPPSSPRAPPPAPEPRSSCGCCDPAALRPAPGGRSSREECASAGRTAKGTAAACPPRPGERCPTGPEPGGRVQEGGGRSSGAVLLRGGGVTADGPTPSSAGTGRCSRLR